MIENKLPEDHKAWLINLMLENPSLSIPEVRKKYRVRYLDVISQSLISRLRKEIKDALMEEGEVIHFGPTPGNKILSTEQEDWIEAQFVADIDRALEAIAEDFEKEFEMQIHPSSIGRRRLKHLRKMGQTPMKKNQPKRNKNIKKYIEALKKDPWPMWENYKNKMSKATFNKHRTNKGPKKPEAKTVHKEFKTETKVSSAAKKEFVADLFRQNNEIPYSKVKEMILAQLNCSIGMGTISEIQKQVLAERDNSINVKINHNPPYDPALEPLAETAVFVENNVSTPIQLVTPYSEEELVPPTLKKKGFFKRLKYAFRAFFRELKG